MRSKPWVFNLNQDVNEMRQTESKINLRILNMQIQHKKKLCYLMFRDLNG